MSKLESIPGETAGAVKLMKWSMALLLTAFVAGCGGGGGGDPILGGGGGGAAPTIPGAPAGAIIPGAVCTAGAGALIPTVTMSDPTSGNQFVTTSTQVGAVTTNKLITATFSLAMNAATINSTTFTLAPVGGVVIVPAVPVAYNANTKVATLTVPALTANTSYTAIITVGAVTSAGGVPIACSYAWNFKTAPLPAVAGPASVNLGLATPFAISSAGGVTNTATAPLSHINGDAILNPNTTCNAVAVDAAGGFGLCGGMAPTITGTVISSLFNPGGNLATIQSDFLAGYNSLDPASLPGATVLGCGTIGSGGGAGALIGCSGNATLPPGVYISATATTIGVTGVLTLDGGGDTNARFVFQAPTALTTAAGAPGVPGSQILLINGAKASNVWWWVGGSGTATIGTYADFNGNILGSGAIVLGTAATSCGRLLAGALGAGNFVFDTNVVSVPGHASAPVGCQ